ncbi:MAG: family 20 glycosylhydrolase [Bacteroidota bacterium]|jgi:hypothetical protein
MKQRTGFVEPGRSRLSIVVLCAAFCLAPQLLVAQVSRSHPSVIPAVSVVENHAGEFVLSRDTPLYSDTMFRDAAALLSELLDDAPWQPLPSESTEPNIRLEFASGFDSPEAYSLIISESGIRIHAQAAAGAYYAVQTLRQMLPSCVESGGRFRAYRIPCLMIADQPRFQWRGVLIDCSRHFLPVPDIKKIIDGMALLKLNRFHWHLTDDQGWRLEIRAYPELTRVGAWRGEGAQRYGGFYTQDEVRDIVAYASRRQIVIVPEIDMPGHATAALAAYPWLGCVGDSIPVATDWGIFETVMCPGREQTFTFISNVLTEVAELFPGPWVHVGGDECMLNRWEKCSACQGRIVQEGLPGTYALQWYFTRRIEDILASVGKTAIGWNEIMAGASKKTLVQAWYHVDVGVEAAERGFQVISSPIEPNYLNYHQRYNTLHRVYSFDPFEGHVWPDSGKALLGIECCLWAESLPTPSHTHRMLFPRIAAVAEAAWTSPANKSWQSFRQRIGVMGGRWLQQGQEFYPIEEVSWDDGLPLNVTDTNGVHDNTMQIEFSAAVEGVASFDNSSTNSGLDPISYLPTFLRIDSTSVQVQYEKTFPGVLSGYALRGLYKRSNVWAEVGDSLSKDGLYHLTDEPGSLFPLSLQCYPNPLPAAGTAAMLTVLATLPEPVAFEISLHDITGKCIRKQEIPASIFSVRTLQINLEDLSSGVYIMQLRAAGASASTTLHISR